MGVAHWQTRSTWHQPQWQRQFEALEAKEISTVCTEHKTVSTAIFDEYGIITLKFVHCPRSSIMYSTVLLVVGCGILSYQV
jgi:hypothetical protein